MNEVNTNHFDRIELCALCSLSSAGELLCLCQLELPATKVALELAHVRSHVLTFQTQMESLPSRNLQLGEPIHPHYCFDLLLTHLNANLNRSRHRLPHYQPPQCFFRAHLMVGLAGYQSS